MQTDIWLTEEITYSERCPLCSQPLKNGSTHASLVVSQRNLQQVHLFGLILQSMGCLFLLRRGSPIRRPKKQVGDLLASCLKREDIQILLPLFHHVLRHNLLTLPLVRL